MRRTFERRFPSGQPTGNRNHSPHPAPYVAYSAIVGRETIAGGEHLEDIRLGASGLTVVKVPLSIRPESIVNAARDCLLGRAVTYEFNGSVGPRTPGGGVVRLPFSQTGGLGP